MVTPVDYFLEVDSDLNRMWEQHMLEYEAILQSDDDKSFFTLYEKEDNSGESQGLISKLISKIKSFLESIINKIKGIGKGLEVDPAKKNTNIHLDKDPSLVVKFLNGDIKSSKDYLQKAARGEVSIEEAQKFVQKQDSLFGTIKSATLPAVAIAAGAAANKLFLQRWRDEAHSALEDVERSSSQDFAGKVANTYDKGGKNETAKEASKIILNHINASTKKGLDHVLGPIRSLYQQGFIKNEILSDAEKRNDPKYKTKQRLAGIAAGIKGSMTANKIIKDRKTRDSNADIHSKNQKINYKAKNKVQKAMNQSYDDVDGYVDEDALGKSKNKKKKNSNN